jgi:hypothetical protein
MTVSYLHWTFLRSLYQLGPRYETKTYKNKESRTVRSLGCKALAEYGKRKDVIGGLRGSLSTFYTNTVTD